MGSDSQTPGASRRRMNRAELGLLAIPGVWAAGRIMLHNIAGIPHLERYLGLMMMLWLLGIGVARLLVRVGLTRKPAVYTSFVLTTCLVSFGPLSRQLGVGIAVLGALALTLAASWLAVRLDGSLALDAVVVAGAVFLLSGPVVIGVEGVSEYGEEALGTTESVTLSMDERPDIWLVVLDGYPGSITLEADYGVGSEDQLGTRLRSDGFDVPSSAWAAFITTRWSVPSMLQMGYPATSWTDNTATLQALYDTISGDNSLFDVLESNGYQTTMIEAGWSGSSCGPKFDHCVVPPLYDDAANLIAFDSVLGGADFATPGYGFAMGSQSTMRHLLELAGQERTDDVPSFVFAHLLAPHPPLFMNETCDITVDGTRLGLFYPYPGVSAADRDKAFLGQVACVNSFVLDFVDRVGPNDLVIFMADHGTGRRAQIATPPEEWSDDAIRERMNIFLAARLPGTCSVGDPVILPNLMRRVLSCYSESSLADLEPRMVLGHDVELDVAEVRSLLDSAGP